MRAVLIIGGWITALVAGAVAFATRRSLGARMEEVARASHELRGGICAARLGLELACRRGEVPPHRQRALELELGRAALAIEQLDGRTAARALQEVDLRSLLADSVEAWRAVAVAGATELRARWTGPNAMVLGDRIRLAQAAGNLIANAIEHGGDEVELRGRLDGDHVRVEVVDSGTGLPAPVDELAGRARRGRGRRGRGLAIASEIACAHGGRLASAPSEGGAKLVLELPLARQLKQPADTA
jgi:signal transduction histidine kinase